MLDFAVVQMSGDDADHAAAFGQRGIGGQAHQPAAAAAIDQRDAGLGQRPPEPLGGLDDGRARTDGGATEDGDGLQRRHLLQVSDILAKRTGSALHARQEPGRHQGRRRRAEKSARGPTKDGR